MEITHFLWTILYTILEFITYFLLLYKILHLSITRSRLRRLVSLLLVFSWFILHYYINLPGTFLNIIILFLIFAEKWYFKLCWIFIHTLLLNIVSGSILYILCILFGTGREYLYAHISSIITLNLFYAAIFFLSKKIPADKKLLRDLGWQSYCLIAFVVIVDFLLSSVSSALLVMDINRWGRYFLIIAILIMVCMSIILLITYFRLRYYHAALQQRDEINQDLLQLEVEHYHELQRKTLDLRAFRHDYNAHLIAMKGLASAEKTDKLKAYVKELSEFSEKINYIMTNHPVADAIISYYYEPLINDIQFHINGKFPDRIFLNDTDLCIILSNLSRNAVEAVSRQKQTENPRINMSIYADDSYATIVIENTSEPYPEGKLSHLPTSKQDKTSHGFGLQNVREVTEKYNGRLELKYEDGIFMTSVYLRNPG